MPATLLQFRYATDLETTLCPSCGVEVWSACLPERRNNGKDCYCINGHVFRWAETEAIRLRRQLDAANASLARAESDADWQRAQAKNARIQETKAKNALKRTTTRINAGVCPHCNRTFQQLARHMHCKHADVLAKSV